MCGLWRELCCCRSSRRISDSYFLLEMLGSAAPRTIRVKQSRFFPLPARFGCWGGLVFTFSLPAFSGWRLCAGKVCQCCPRMVSSHGGKMLGRGWQTVTLHLCLRRNASLLFLLQKHVENMLCSMAWNSLGIRLHSMGDRSLPCLVLAINISLGWEGSKGEHPGALVSVDWLCSWLSWSNFHLLHPADSCLVNLGRGCKDVSPSLQEVHYNSKLQFTSDT